MSRLVKRTAAGAIIATALGVATISQVGTEEGLRLRTYKDTVGVSTYCYGETKNAVWGRVYTKAYCDELLLKRIDEFATKVEKCVKQPMSDKTEVSFVSFAYNIGQGGFCSSSTVRLYNQGRKVEACNAMMKWTKQRELIGRRTREKNLCLAGVKEG
jgi:lysozyme